MAKKFLGLRGQKLHNAITFASTMGFLLFGYDQGVMSGIITGKTFNAEFPPTKERFPNDVHASTIQGTVTAVYEIGCLVGSLFAMFYGDRFGRRKMMIVGAVIMSIGTILMIVAFKPHWQLGQFIIGRVVCGIGNGMNTATIPSWQAESSKPQHRGALICFEASMIAIGTVIAYWIDFGFDFIDNSVAWRFPISFQIVFAIILFACVMYLPESPRWLLAHDYVDEATEIVAALNDVEIDDDLCIAEREAMWENIRQSSATKVSNKELFTGGKTQHFRRVILGSSSQFMQQIGGCNAVIYYAPVLFQQSLGNPRVLSLVLSGVTIIVYAIFACMAFWLVEKVGRRPLFLWGSLGQAVSMTIVFACLIPSSLEPGTDHARQTAKGSAFGIFLYLAFFGATWLCLPWLYPAEVSPTRIRTQANGLSTSCNWLMNFTIVQVVPVMISSIQWGTYLFFACINFGFIPFVWLLYIETKGRTLEEVDIIFAKAFVEKKNPINVSYDLPALSTGDVLRTTKELGIYDDEIKGDNQSVSDSFDSYQNKEAEGQQPTPAEESEGSFPSVADSPTEHNGNQA